MQEVVVELLESKKQLDALISKVLRDLNTLGLSTNDLQSSISKISNVFKDLAYFDLLSRPIDNENLYELSSDNLHLLIHIQTGIKYYCKSSNLFSCDSLLYLPPEFRTLGEQFVKTLKSQNKKININFTGDFIETTHASVNSHQQINIDNDEDELTQVARLKALEKSSSVRSYTVNPKFAHLQDG